MKYLPILDELFHSDLWIIALVSFIIAFIAGFHASGLKKDIRATLVCLVFYAISEYVLTLRSNYFIQIVVLFAGSAAFGMTLGFSISAFAVSVKKHV